MPTLLELFEWGERDRDDMLDRDAAPLECFEWGERDRDDTLDRDGDMMEVEAGDRDAAERETVVRDPETEEEW